MFTSILYVTTLINFFFVESFVYEYRFFYQSIVYENAELYKEQLMQLLESSEWNNVYSESNHHWKQLLQKGIDKANVAALKSQKR